MWTEATPAVRAVLHVAQQCSLVPGDPEHSWPARPATSFLLGEDSFLARGADRRRAVLKVRCEVSFERPTKHRSFVQIVGNDCY